MQNDLMINGGAITVAFDKGDFDSISASTLTYYKTIHRLPEVSPSDKYDFWGWYSQPIAYSPARYLRAPVEVGGLAQQEGWRLPGKLYALGKLKGFPENAASIALPNLFEKVIIQGLDSDYHAEYAYADVFQTGYLKTDPYVNAIGNGYQCVYTSGPYEVHIDASQMNLDENYTIYAEYNPKTFTEFFLHTACCGEICVDGMSEVLIRAAGGYLLLSVDEALTKESVTVPVTEYTLRAPHDQISPSGFLLHTTSNTETQPWLIPEQDSVVFYFDQ